VHWFCDRFFEEDSRVIGAALIHPFREHHRDPLAMTRHGVLELTGNSCVGLLPVLAAAWWWGAPAKGTGGAFVYAALLVFAVAVFATNVLHKWAHAVRVPPAVAWLQDRHVILGAAAHAPHHRAGHHGTYCVTAGWMNPVSDACGVFRGLERVLRAAGVPATATGD
jgi:ubiquitin-conjugating enzyme E2 variant